MKSIKRSQGKLVLSFPKTPAKGTSVGNEEHLLEVDGLRIRIKVPADFRGMMIKRFFGALNYKTGSIPFIGVGRFSRDREGKIKKEVVLFKLQKLLPTSKRAGDAIIRRYFPSFFKTAELEPKNPSAWAKALAIDCASVFKNAVVVEPILITDMKQWRVFANALRKTPKADELDYLLANYYERKGWNQFPLEKVGAVVAKLLKLKKPLPTTTLNRRLANLGFASLPVGRPETKYK